MVSVSVPVVVVLVAVMAAAVTDLRLFKIHNLLTLPLVASGPVYHAVTDGSGGLQFSLLGALFGFGVLLPFYAVGGMGAGDVKLLAGVGAWLGLLPTFVVFVAASLAAGLYAAVVIAADGLAGVSSAGDAVTVRQGALCLPPVECDRADEMVLGEGRRRLVPFGAMTAAGLIVLLALTWLQSAG